MPTLTANELAVIVAKGMNHLRPGEDLVADDAAEIVNQYRMLHAELVDKQVAYWPFDAIPMAIAKRLSDAVQVEAAPSFGAMPIVLAAMAANSQASAREKCLMALRIHAEVDYEFEPVPIIAY